MNQSYTYENILYFLMSTMSQILNILIHIYFIGYLTQIDQSIAFILMRSSVSSHQDNINQINFIHMSQHVYHSLTAFRNEDPRFILPSHLTNIAHAIYDDTWSKTRRIKEKKNKMHQQQTFYTIIPITGKIYYFCPVHSILTLQSSWLIWSDRQAQVGLLKGGALACYTYLIIALRSNP